MLLLRPESWAEAARYPTRFMLVPLLLAILLAAVGIGISDTWRNFQGIRDFAAGYDARGFPPLELNADGVLSAKGPMETPIRVNLPQLLVIVDPTGKTTVDSIHVPAVFVESKKVTLVGPAGPWIGGSLANVLPMYGIRLPEPGTTKAVNSAALVEYLDRQKAGIVVTGSIGGAIGQSLLESLWVLMMLFMLNPLVILTAAGPRGQTEGPDRRLLLPPRAAYRMVMATLVPLIMLGAFLRVIGHPVTGLLDPEQAQIFWVLAAGALAVWTGFMAKRMYGPKERRK